jgi:hypothetical protein
VFVTNIRPFMVWSQGEILIIQEPDEVKVSRPVLK